MAIAIPLTRKVTNATSPNQLVNLLALHNSMQELLGELATIDFGFSIEISQAKEVYVIAQEAQTIIASENGEAD